VEAVSPHQALRLQLHSSRRTEDRSAASVQVFELFQTRKRPVFKDLFRHVNPLEQIIELFRSASRVPGASDPGKCLRIFSKDTRLAPIVLAGGTKTHATVRKHFAHYLAISRTR